MPSFTMSKIFDKQTQVVLFSSTAIALYGYDQGMMSLINTNYNYLATMGISEESPMVGIIVSVYYLGCAAGAVIGSAFSNAKGRRPAIFATIATAAIGNLIMFVAGLKKVPGAQATMLVGRIVMGLGVGGIDAVVPVYTSELSDDDSRGTALAKEFQANIFGLNMAFIVNVFLTHSLTKYSQWAWRLPIIIMQVYPILLFSGTTLLPETPRWFVLHDKIDKAKRAIHKVWGEESVDSKIESLTEAHKKEQEEGEPTYADLCFPSGSQFHSTAITVMGQVNQALTGYGAVSVYGPQIFELLSFSVTTSEYLTLGNYVFYFLMMTFAWLLIDVKGRRYLMILGAFWLAVSFGLLAILGGLSMNMEELHIPLLATGIPGIIVLYLATATFGVTWLVPPWLIPTEIYPSTARAQGAAISVVIWGLANFAMTLLTPIGFNNMKYWLFAVFCGTNLFAGVWTYLYVPESGWRTFEENQEFFKEAAEKGSWVVQRVKGGEWRGLPEQEEDEEGGETEQGSGGGQRKGKGKGKKAGGETEPLLGSRDE